MGEEGGLRREGRARWRVKEKLVEGIADGGEGGDRETRQSHCDDRDAPTSRGANLSVRDLEKVRRVVSLAIHGERFSARVLSGPRRFRIRLDGSGPAAVK